MALACAALIGSGMCLATGTGVASAVNLSTPTPVPATATPIAATATAVPTVAPRATPTTGVIVVASTATFTAVPASTISVLPPPTATFTPQTPAATVPPPATPTFTFTPQPATSTPLAPTSTPIAATSTVAPSASSTPISPTATPAAPLGGVVINEVLANPQNIRWDSNAVDPRVSQWLELYNTTSTAINLTNWSVEAPPPNSSTKMIYAFPSGTTIAPQGYFVVFRSALPQNIGQGIIQLLDPNGNVVDSVSPPSLPADQSYARLPDGSGNWVVDPSPTLGNANTLVAPVAGPDLQATVYAIQTQLAMPIPSPPVAPELDDGSLDAADTADGRRTRVRKIVPYRTLSIAEIRGLPDDTPVITTGVITMPNELFDSARGYIQGDGAGILIHPFGTVPLHLADNLTIKGRVHHFHGEVEVAAVKNGERVSPGGTLPAPLVTAPGGVGSPTEALVVQIAGRVESLERDYALVGDDAASARVFLYTRLGLPAGSLKTGQTVTFTGVVNAADASSAPQPSSRGYAQRLPLASHRLVPRLLGDVIVDGVPLGPTAPATTKPDRARPAASGLGETGVPEPGSPESIRATATAAAIATAFVTPVRSSRQPGAAAAPEIQAENALVLGGGSGQRPWWMWLSIGLGVLPVGGGAAMLLAPRWRNWRKKGDYRP